METDLAPGATIGSAPHRGTPKVVQAFREARYEDVLVSQSVRYGDLGPQIDQGFVAFESLSRGTLTGGRT